MPTNKKILFATIAAFLFLLLSAVCWYYGHWYCFFIPTIALYLTEYGCRIYKLKQYVPPLCGFLIPKPKRPEISTTADQLPVSANILITSISQWMLKDMIQCSFYGNFSSLGTGTTEQLQAAYNNLISQYYEARKDESMKDYIQLMGKIATIELHISFVSSFAAILKERYSIAAAAALSKLPPHYPYTEDTYLKDLEMQGKALIRSTIDLERLVKRRDEMEAENGSAAKQTPEQKHHGLVQSLMDINKYEGVKYDVNTMTVLEYAIAENRIKEHIEHLKDQAKQNANHR